MSILQTVTRGNTRKPIVCVYGTHGVGKTTFACGAPDPVVLRTEDGLGLLDTPALPVASDWDTVVAQIGALLTEEHAYKSLVFDSMDHLEPLIWAQVCTEHNCGSIEDLGFGKGYVAAMTYWGRLFDGLDKLRTDKDMFVVLIAHSEVRTFHDPTSDPYDRYQIKMHKRASALLQEKADAVLFADYEKIVSTNDDGRTRARGEGDRLMYTEERPSFLAKNRWRLPPSLPLSWDALMAAITKSRNANKEAK